MFTKQDKIALEYHRSPERGFIVTQPDQVVLRKDGEVTYSNDDQYVTIANVCFKNDEFLCVLKD